MNHPMNNIVSISLSRLATRFSTYGFLAVLIAGCAVTKDYSKPDVPEVSLKGVEDRSTFTNASPVGNWWLQFDDPLLAELVEQALTLNHDVRSAITRINQARAVFTEQQLSQFPRITAGGSIDRREQMQVLAGERMSTEIHSLGFDAAWEIDIFGRQKRAVEQANAIVGATEADLRSIQVSIVGEVARNYFELRGVQKRIDIALTTISNLKDSLRLNKTLWEQGMGSEVNYQLNQTQLKSIEAEIPYLEVSSFQYKYRLAVLTGKTPGSIDEKLIAKASPPFARELPLGDTRNLLRQRPDIQSAERRLAAATAQVGVATADLFPRVNLAGFIGFISGSPGSLISTAGRAWSITPSFRWAAFDLGSVRARLRASDARAEDALIDYERSVLNALEEAQNAVNQYSMQQARIKIIEEQVIAARRAEDLARIRYKEGADTYLQLLETQRSRLAADEALARTEAQINIQVAAIYKGLGGNPI